MNEDMIGSSRGNLPMVPEQASASAAAGPGLTDVFRRLVEAVPNVAMLLLDTDGNVMTWNRGAEAIKGYQPHEIIGRHISTFYTAEAVAVGHPDRELELAALTGRYAEEGWRVRQDGHRFWAHVQILAIRDDDGDLIGFGKVTVDLTDARQRDEQLVNVLSMLEKTIRLDHLTGLPNRRAWDEGLDQEIGRSRQYRRPLCVALLDLDHFKRFNDRHGHQAGDKLLKRAALRWRQVLRPADLLARYGGEEFILAMPDCEIQEARGVVDRLLTATPDEQTLSAGLASWDFEESTDDLLSRIDRALYAAKAAGRNQVKIAPLEMVAAADSSNA